MNNIGKIRQAVSEHEFDAMMITGSVSRLYATGFESSSGVLLITAKDAWFLVDSRYIEAAESAISGASVRLVTKDATYETQIKVLLDDCGISSVAFEESTVTHSAYLRWSEKLGVELVPAQKLIDGLRAVKSEDDLDNMKKAQRVAEKSFKQILPLIDTTITEKKLAAELIYRFLTNGADDKSFDPIIVSGKRSSLPHGTPGDNKISPGFLTIDFGVRLNGWCSDTTRTLCVGKPNDEMVNVYNTVLKAQEAGINAIRGGVSGVEVDAAARAVIGAAGYGEYFGHGFGHSLGLEVHETPTASQRSKDVLPTGAIISAEPGIYLPGRFGVRIEDVLYVTEYGAENITNLSKELIVI